ncbi:MAG TPA: GvpL/GvpF family gas vesicle protein [Vicinamibacterales bacterium]|jgi:hypothetical protein
MPVCIYAVVPVSTRVRRQWRGVNGESLKVVPCGDAAIVVGTMTKAGRPDMAGLERHDTLMRAIASSTPATLPARFGVVVNDLARVRASVTASGISFRKALRLVSGREQMTLRIRVTGKPRLSGRPHPSNGITGPGQQYLAARMRQTRLPPSPALRALRRRLSAVVCEERFRLKGTSATLYHLIERGRSSDYLDLVRAFSVSHPRVRLTASGPFPPYAFAPGLNQ